MRRALFAIVGVLVLMIAAVVGIGSALPEAHVASRKASLAAPPDKIFAVLLDVDRYPAWRSDVKSVEVLARTPRLRWREDASDGAITFEIEDARAPSRLVTRIADTSLAFGGSWTYELSPEGAGTTLAITEHGEVYNPVFRFLSRFVFGHTATLDRVLADLRAHLRTS